MIKYGKVRRIIIDKTRGYNMGFWQRLIGEEPSLLQQWLNYDDKGSFGEYLIKYALANIPGYQKVLRNIYVPYNGKTSEIGVLMIHEKGIFMFESKNYSGWIFGGLENTQWTQCLPNKQKSRFYNPIMQNKTHIKALVQFLNIDMSEVISYVIFSQRCELKDVPNSSTSCIILKRPDMLRHLKSDIKGRNIVYTKQDELKNVENNMKFLDEGGVRVFLEELDENWNRIEDLKNQMTLGQEIESGINYYLEYKILETINKESIDSILELIDGIGNLIEDNYNKNYLKDTGTFNSVYRLSFINSEIDKLKKLINILFQSIDERSGKVLLKIDRDTDKIKDFIEIYDRSNIIYNLCEIEYRNISSGEKAFLNICSRFYSIKNYIDKNKDSNENIVILIDEIDLYFHPQWQKELIHNLIHLLSKIYENKKIQIILTSHSPFVLSDIQKCNLIFMDKDSNGKCIVCKGIEEEKETFAANIHTLFTDSFFIKDGLVGKLAKEKINKVISDLSCSKNFKNNEEKENIKKLIYSIGEPLIRNKLMIMYEQKIDINKMGEINDLKKEIRFLAERIEQLENNDSKHN